eukprot:s880_g1.t1
MKNLVCRSGACPKGCAKLSAWPTFYTRRFHLKKTMPAIFFCSTPGSKIAMVKRRTDAVCQRAVSEEMGQLVDAETLIMPGSTLPFYDAANKSRINVVKEVFKDHVIEIEDSKSFPGLLTMYNLYRVDIVCTGLPTLNFNTLEFNEPDKDGQRKLKYMHAWVWLKLDVIQRYLFEGSTLKERVGKGSFESPEQLQDWLSQFGVVLSSSDSGRLKSVEELFEEVEKEKCSLEHYGRLDGLPILLRVVHVVQVKLTNRHHLAHQSFLIQEAKQRGSSRTWESVHRHLSTKVNMGRDDFDHDFFANRAASLVEESIYSITDVHYSINPKAMPKEEDFQKTRLEVEEASRRVGSHHTTCNLPKGEFSWRFNEPWSCDATFSDIFPVAFGSTRKLHCSCAGGRGTMADEEGRHEEGSGEDVEQLLKSQVQQPRSRSWLKAALGAVAFASLSLVLLAAFAPCSFQRAREHLNVSRSWQLFEQRGPTQADRVKHAQDALGAVSSDEDIHLTNSGISWFASIRIDSKRGQ